MSSFLGADTDELRIVGQECEQAKETVDGVIAFLKALIALLRAASFFSGGASAAYAQYLETVVLPWMQKISMALGLFAKVLNANADAQDQASDGSTVPAGSLPTYTSQVGAGSGGVQPYQGAPLVTPGVQGAAPSQPPSQTAALGQIAQIAQAALGQGGTPGSSPLAGTTIGGSTIGGATGGFPVPAGGTAPTLGSTLGSSLGSAGPAAGQIAPCATIDAKPLVTGYDATSQGAFQGQLGTAGGSHGAVAAAPTGGALGSGSGLGGGLGGGGGLGSGDVDGAGHGSAGSPGVHTSDGTSGFGGGSPGSEALGAASAPLADAARVGGDASGTSYGAAATIGAGAAALGVGGAALAASRGAGATDPTVDAIASTNGRGSSGAQVRELQQRLTDAGYDTHGVDGQWGRGTEAAYQAYREAHPLPIREGTGWTSPDGFDYTQVTGVRGNERVTPEFLRGVEGVAQRVGARPEHLLAAMSFETGGSFRPDIVNPRSGATGLIQFMPDTAPEHGTTTEALARMTPTEQLPYVERYLERFRGRVGDVPSLYSSILGGHPMPHDQTMFTEGTADYRQNRELDSDGDGRITVREAADQIDRRLAGRR